jgi:hypothetical protein
MKKLLKKILVFLIILFSILLFADIVYSKKLINNNQISYGEIETFNFILNETDNVDFLIYGSSRAKSNFDVQSFKINTEYSIENLGIQGHNFWLQYLRHLKYLKSGRIPKNIIVNIDWMTFQKKPDLYNYNQFLPYMLWDFDIYNFTKSYEAFTFFDYFIPFYRYIGRTDILFTSLNKNKSKNHIKNESRFNNNIDTIHFHKPTINLFSNFINECQSLKIKLYFVHAPDFIDNQKKYINRDDLIFLIGSISKKHEILFLNYSNHPLSYNKEYYKDIGHMNIKGAKKFTEILVDTLKIK